MFTLASPPAVPDTILPGGFLNVSVRFRPTSQGVKTANLEIANNDPDENPFTVTLTGSGASPTISITPPNLNFGRVLVDFDSTKILSISNTGAADLIINDLEVLNNPDTVYTILNKPPLPFRITPSSPPLLLQVEMTPKAEGPVNASLTISHNDLVNDPSLVPLSGRGVNAQIAVTEDTLSFGEITVTDFADLSVQVSNTGEGPLFITSREFFGANDDQFEIVNPAPLPIKINPNAAPKTITVRFRPTAIGFKDATLFLFNNDPDASENPFRIKLQGRGVKPDIDSAPETLLFGEVQVDSTKRLSTAIKNSGNEILIVSNIGIVGNNADQFTFEQVPLPFSITPFSDDSVVVNVTFAPTTQGDKTAMLRFTNNTPDENPFDVPLSGIGTVPDIDARPNPLDFGKVVLDSTAIAVVEILNRGRAPLTISDTTISGPHARLFSIVMMDSLPIVIPPDTTRSAAITIQFTPDSLNDKTATLELTSNDPDELPFLVTLRGRGVQPDIAANPNPAEFDSVRVGTEAFLNLQVMNVGEADLVINDTALAGTNVDLFSIDSIGTLPITVPKDSGFVWVKLKFLPDTLGFKTANLQFTSNDPDDSLFTVPLSGSGELPEIAAFPSPLDFGSVGIGAQGTQTLNLINLSLIHI